MRVNILKTLTRFRKDERGVTLVEYGVAITLAIVVGTTLLTVVGTQINSNMTDAKTAMACRSTTGC